MAPRDQYALSDVVPVLRPDLKIGDPVPGRGESEIRVEDTSTGKFLVIKGFELSLARMLNGRRTAENVLNAAGQIGLPLSIESLNGFLRKLRKEGFLTDIPGLAPLDITTWEARSEWNEEIRRLFQEALREARADRFIAAKSRLDALLARSPGIQEAQQLLHWVMERLVQQGADPGPAFSDVFAEVEKSWFNEGEQSSAANERLARSRPSFEDPTEKAAEGWKPPGKSKKGLVFGVLAIAVAGGLVVAPLPHTATAPFTLQPRAVTDVKVTRAGALAAIAVTEGQWVTKGTVLATWDPAAAQKKVAATTAKLAEVKKQNVASAASTKKLNEARAKLAKSTIAAAKAADELAKLKAKAKGKKTPLIAKAEKKSSVAAAAVAADEKAVAALTVPTGPEIQGQVAMLEGELAKAKAEAADPGVVADADGFVRALGVKPGQPIEAGALLTQLEDSKVLKVVIVVPRGEMLEVGSPLQLKIGPLVTKAAVDKVDGSGAQTQLDNADGSLKGGATGVLSFPGAPMSILSRINAS